MKKIFTALAIILTLTLGAVFPLLTQNKISARADAIGESTEEIDSLFVEVGAELKTLDSSCNIIDGEKSDYLAQFDEEGKCIKSGFKLIEEGDYIGKKTIYFYTTSQRFVFTINVNTLTITYKEFEPTIPAFNRTYCIGSILNNNEQYAKMLFDSTECFNTGNYSNFDDIVTGTQYYSMGAGSSSYAFAYLYFEDESDSSENESSPPTSETVDKDGDKI